MIGLKFIKTKFAKVITVMLLLLFFVSTEVIFIDSKKVFAQNSDSKQLKRLKTIRSSHPDPRSKIKIKNEIQNAVNAEDYPEAHRLLNELDKDPSLTVIERAYFANFRGNICFSIDDFDCALVQFKSVINMGEEVPESFRNQMLYVVTQVLFSQENYYEALSYAQRWFKTLTEPTVGGYILIGQIYYQLKEYDKALSNVLYGIEQSTSVGNVPTEGSLSLLTGIYRKTGQLEKVIPVIKQLIRHYPKETYQLALDKVKDEIDYSKK